jgi:peptidoglycan/LPS O-acetylase OafA/YrhL
MPCRADALAIGVLAALLWRNQSFRAWLSTHVQALYALGGIVLAGIVGLCEFSASPDALGMQSVGYTLIAAFYAIVLLHSLAVPAGVVAVITGKRWLGEIGRVSYCLYLIHDAIRGVFGVLYKIAFNNPHSWQVVVWNATAAAAAYGLARLSWAFFEYPLLLRGHEFKY